ncbi:Cdc14 phosphatase binding protein N-terminus-domain-containing protein [Lipomyces tetrasporus]|uniref:Cdc14 phosphatase binding protein N-terminus-domain-containing protein n=1 Tax=Lipomyces tetrasporus TaxID=54092 RepID=A0AAD7QQ70_9ASCO|nr:Cdc14 phosphatase binding protein N-terminus-domain-containing protein [Lipomyces tetrasporus]KAJ8097847.1 Cdc14 phosphatase binding protein N-terminus-domain-containing protein [Lipomyces tetrasporus]
MTSTSAQFVRLQVYVGHNAAGGYNYNGSFDSPASLQATPPLLTGSPLPNYGSSYKSPSGKKFIHITKPSTSIRQLKEEIISRHEKIYREPLDIDSMRDEHECDLDDDYSVSQIFNDRSIVRVFANDSKIVASSRNALQRTPSSLQLELPLAEEPQERNTTQKLENMPNTVSDRQGTGPGTGVTLLSPSKTPKRARKSSSVSSLRASASPESHKAKRARIDGAKRSSSPELMVLDSQGQLVSGAEDSQPSPSRTAVRSRVIEKSKEREPNVETVITQETIIPDSQVPVVQRPPIKPSVAAMAKPTVPIVATKIAEKADPMKFATKASSNGIMSQHSAASERSNVSSTPSTHLPVKLSSNLSGNTSDSESSGSSDTESTNSEYIEDQTITSAAGGSQSSAIKYESVGVEKPALLPAVVKAPLLEKRVPSLRSLSELAKLGVPDVRESTTGIRAIQSQITNDQKRADMKVIKAESGSDNDDSSDSDSGSSSDSDEDKSDDESGIPVNRRASGVLFQKGDGKKKRYSSGFRALFNS